MVYTYKINYTFGSINRVRIVIELGCPTKKGLDYRLTAWIPLSPGVPVDAKKIFKAAPYFV